jgi:hypothetical protein
MLMLGEEHLMLTMPREEHLKLLLFNWKQIFQTIIVNL